MINAMIFAAGLGTRLQPFTHQHPKALAEVNGVPLLEIALKKIEQLGIKKVVVNVHHFSQQIISFINNYKSKELQILISDESNQLLNTGGGLLKASSLFDKFADILIFNVDVVTNAPLQELIKTHKAEKNLATLMVQERNASRFLLFNQQNQLVGWRNPKTKEELWSNHKYKNAQELGFNGVHIVQHQLLKLLSSYNNQPFSIIPEYVKLSSNHAVKGWRNWEGSWIDVGTPEKLNQAATQLAQCTDSEKKLFF